MNFKEVLNSPEYNFIRDNERFGDRIMLLGLGGSHAYGTNNEDSDIDFRGVTLQQPSDLIGLTEFEQYVDKDTDTVIYGFNKFVKLLLNCNPNICEIIGLNVEQFLIKSKAGQELIDNHHIFLSKRAISSFGGYADAQLRRIQNAIARDSLDQGDREKHILRSVTSALDDFNRRYFGKVNMVYVDSRHTNDSSADSKITGAGIRLYIDKSDKTDYDTEIFLDSDYKHFPLRDYNEMLTIMRKVAHEYDNIGKRNRKKDDKHLNKHAMHLVRLLMMAVDILDKREIITYRKDDLTLLLAIRRGDYMNADGTFSVEFYEILDEYEHKLDEAAKRTTLPDEPDMDKVGKFVEHINRKYVIDV